MLDATAALLTYQAAIYFATGKPPVRMGNRHPTIVPYETFEGTDGAFVLAVGNDEQWRRFCTTAGIDALANDARFATNRDRVAHYADLKPVLESHLRTRPRDEWIRVLTAAGIPCGSVRDIGEVLVDPQVAARNMIQTVDHQTLGSINVLGTPLKLSETPGAVRQAPPTLGQHTDAILREFGE
jgi:crotonobetainyl-CoA:carnitine CoA-transferase CaiB-like acyl-CoA transferase